ncbi:MAG: GAF domain-containing protein [Pseudomonadota bacterium]|nr:GAF domain-containing protein [Pseudomonadota bacterium]
MSLFVKAAEVWQPDLSGQFLVLASSHYGDLAQFESASQAMAFAFAEGMPGRTWAERRPLIWTDLSGEDFKRSQLAQDAGLACALSIPVFAGDFLLGVVVLFCGAGSDLSGAVEVWHNPSGSNNELKLADGYYGQLERFGWISRRLTMLRGRGLPGQAWDQNRPVMINDLPHSNSFLRARNAEESGITSGLAIPFSYSSKDVRVVTFLSTLSTPIAKRFEVWVPDRDDRYLLFRTGFCSESSDLEQRYLDTAFTRGQGALGETWLSGRPLVEECDHANHERCVFIPFIVEGKLHSIITLVF